MGSNWQLGRYSDFCCILTAMSCLRRALVTVALAMASVWLEGCSSIKSVIGTVKKGQMVLEECSSQVSKTTESWKSSSLSELDIKCTTFDETRHVDKESACLDTGALLFGYAANLTHANYTAACVSHVFEDFNFDNAKAFDEKENTVPKEVDAWSGKTNGAINAGLDCLRAAILKSAVNHGEGRDKDKLQEEYAAWVKTCDLQPAAAQTTRLFSKHPELAAQLRAGPQKPQRMELTSMVVGIATAMVALGVAGFLVTRRTHPAQKEALIPAEEGLDEVVANDSA